MRNMILGIALTLIALGSSAQAESGVDCGQQCAYYKHGPKTGLRAPVPGMVCFVFDQDAPAAVEFGLYTDRTKSKLIRPLLKRDFGVSGAFCLGSQWVRRAGWVEICNDFPDHPGNHSNRGIPSLQQGLHTGLVSMCLRGEACSRFVR